MKNVLAIKNSKAIPNCFMSASTSTSSKVQNFEIKLCMFYAEHNVAFQIVEHLLPLLKETVTY